MGANATTSVPVYASGEVLTAANLNITNSGIPVFATTVTRDAAFGGTGEKTLAEGQFAYIEATNTTQYYDGAAWQSVGTTPGLTYLTGATFTTATSVSLPTNTFSATYLNYKLFFQLTALTADSDFTMRFRASGTDDTTAQYNTAFTGNSTALGAAQFVGAALTSIKLGESDGPLGNNYYLTLDIMQPKATAITNISGGVGFVSKPDSYRAFFAGGGNFNLTTSFDSLTIISSTASSMTGNYRVYGYSES
jgi:hypothetical protein